MAIPTFTSTGTKATTAAKLNKDIFGLTVENHQLLKQAYVAYLANGRLNLAKAKTRGEVSGGGRKPWKQKGTGRARFGSSRTPIWRGGGITFGPTGEENYTHKLPTSSKRLATRQALSMASSENKLIVLESLELAGKTAGAVKLLASIGANRTILIVVEDKTTAIIRSFQNLTNVKVVQARYVNVYDTVNADAIVVTKAALSIIDEWLGGAK